MPDKGWHRPFDDPIPPPDGGELRTLRDAGQFIAKLPTRQHDALAWRAAIQALMLVAEHGGDTSCRALVSCGAPIPAKRRQRISPERPRRGDGAGLSDQ